MTDRPPTSLSSAALLSALARGERSTHSEARAFITAHRGAILAGLTSGYSIAQVLRGLQRLEIAPPMSERQFYRYARSILRDSMPAEAAGGPEDPTRVALSAPAQARNAEEPAAPAAPRPTPVSEGSGPPTARAPKTFDWHPEADLDDLR